MRLRGRTASLPPDYLGASLRAPVSPYEIKAGTIIPAVLLSAVNSDLPEQVLGQVREAVYDTENGQHLLVPQETRLVGSYDHHVVYGQERVPYHLEAADPPERLQPQPERRDAWDRCRGRCGLP